MREIKFRAWDLERKEMMYQKENEGIIFWRYDKYGYKEVGLDVYSEELAPMQYTGHKDKNGKEIFEGDKYHMGDPNITYTVVWHDTGLIGKQDGSGSFAGIDHWKDKIEVIGNVFEGATNGSS